MMRTRPCLIGMLMAAAACGAPLACAMAPGPDESTDLGLDDLRRDRTPPVVSITSPLAGQTVGGTVPYSAAATDNFGVTRVELYVDGAQVAGSPDTTAPYAVSWNTTLLADGSHTLVARAYDAAGNAGRDEIGVTIANGAPPAPYAIRGMYDLDHYGLATEQAIGFSYVFTVPTVSAHDQLQARGLKSLVWLGQYSNSSCSFVRSDDWVRTNITAILSHPANGHLYAVTDEPDSALCPSAPTQIHARSNLIHSLDAEATTLLTAYKIPQFASWVGTVDLIAPDGYPCYQWDTTTCDYARIDAQAAELDRLGARYLAVVQAHADDPGGNYRLPTPSELHQQLVRWRATSMEGYFVFAWRWPPLTSSLWLENQPALQGQLRIENSN